MTTRSVLSDRRVFDGGLVSGASSVAAPGGDVTRMNSMPRPAGAIGARSGRRVLEQEPFRLGNGHHSSRFLLA